MLTATHPWPERCFKYQINFIKPKKKSAKKPKPIGYLYSNHEQETPLKFVSTSTIVVHDSSYVKSVCYHSQRSIVIFRRLSLFQNVLTQFNIYASSTTHLSHAIPCQHLHDTKHEAMFLTIINTQPTNAC